MIAKEFLSALEAVSQGFQWRLSPPLGELRGFLPRRPSQPFHPVSALCFMETGRYFPPEDWVKAAALIELTWLDSADIAAAADNRLITVQDRVSIEDPYRRMLRQNLIRAAGLKPPLRFMRKAKA